jgi:hypothetical protein
MAVIVLILIVPDVAGFVAGGAGVFDVVLPESDDVPGD